MEWGLYLAGLVLAAGVGFAGGWAALLSDRRRRTATPEEAPPEARFRLEHLDGMTWALVNVGNAPGALVRVVPLVDGLEQWPPRALPGQVESATSELLPTIAPRESMSVWLSRYDTGQQVIVSWTAESRVRMGPVRLDVPPPR